MQVQEDGSRQNSRLEQSWVDNELENSVSAPKDQVKTLAAPAQDPNASLSLGKTAESYPHMSRQPLMVRRPGYM